MDNSIKPIVKWVGGKRQIISNIKKYIPKKYSTYYEPFVGGGAVLFDIKPQKAVINDVNEELINLYKVVKEKPDELIDTLKKHKNEQEYYYQIRELDRDKEKFDSLSDVERAARIHFLNKTCYNGMFRVNSSGEFNVPFGRYKNPDIVNKKTIKAVSKFLNKSHVKIRNCDFEEAVKGIRKEAFVYFDPPYDPISDSSSFTGYDKSGFDREEQKRLKNLCDKLNKRGVRFLLSNSSTKFIRELYNDYKIEPVMAKRAINSKADKRGEIEEVLVRNYE